MVDEKIKGGQIITKGRAMVIWHQQCTDVTAVITVRKNVAEGDDKWAGEGINNNGDGQQVAMIMMLGT